MFSFMYVLKIMKNYLFYEVITDTVQHTDQLSKPSETRRKWPMSKVTDVENDRCRSGQFCAKPLAIFKKSLIIDRYIPFIYGR